MIEMRRLGRASPIAQSLRCRVSLMPPTVKKMKLLSLLLGSLLLIFPGLSQAAEPKPRLLIDKIGKDGILENCRSFAGDSIAVARDGGHFEVRSGQAYLVMKGVQFITWKNDEGPKILAESKESSEALRGRMLMFVGNNLVVEMELVADAAGTLVAKDVQTQTFAQAPAHKESHGSIPFPQLEDLLTRIEAPHLGEREVKVFQDKKAEVPVDPKAAGPGKGPKNGFVPDAESAVRIAEAVWIPIYGKESIERQRPFEARLQDGVWHVAGSLPKGIKGGVALAEIQKTDEKILRVTHGK